ncbi:MAG: glycosyltransferase [Steroidobacteraceae bacterium]
MIDISVIIPTFRRQDQLVEAIDSVLAQQHVTVEVIVIDDSPEGSARSVVEGRDPRVTYLQRDPPSRGKPALVRNSGWPRASGRFVHFLDDDDRVAKDFYRDAVAQFEAHPRQGMVFGRIEPFGEDEASVAHERAFFADAARRAKIAARVQSRRWIVANLLFKRTLLVNSACIIRRECLAALDGYDTTLGLNEDVDLFCRAIRKFGFGFLDRVVVHYRINPNSLIHGRENDDKLVESYQRMYSRYRQTHGAAELFAMKLLARTVLRVL